MIIDIYASTIYHPHRSIPSYLFPLEILMLGRTRKGKYRDFVNVGIEAFVIGFFQQAQAYNINEEDMRDLVDDMRDTPIPDMINAIKNICAPRSKEVSRES